MKIRKATIRDLDSILELSSEMMKFHSNLDSYYEIYSKYEDHEEYYTEQLKRKDALYVIAEDSNKNIVAFSSCYVISIPKTRAPKIGVLVTNFVRKQSRGHGVGTSMLNFRIEWLRKQNVKFLEMNVDARNKSALKLWRKNGFLDYQIKLKKAL